MQVYQRTGRPKKKLKSTLTCDSDTEPESDSESDAETNEPKPKGKPGRPDGTSGTDIAQKKKSEAMFLNELCSRLHAMKKTYPGKRVPKGQLDELVSDMKKEFKMPPEFIVNKFTVCKRMSRGRHVSAGNGPQLPTQHLEGALVDLLCVLADMNKPLAVGEGVSLANELLADSNI